MTQQTIEYRVRPQGTVLDQYYRDRSRVSVIRGPLGSGKTICTCNKLFKLMTEQAPNADGIRPSRYYAVRNTYPDLTSTTIKDWLAMYGDLGRFGMGSKTPPTHQLRFGLEDGTRVRSELIFIALDLEAHVKKLRGAQSTGFWLNELKELRKSLVDMADMRHGRYPSLAIGGVNASWHGMIADTNSCDEDHWLYRLGEEEQPDGWAFFHQPGGLIEVEGQWVENPHAENVANLPPGYYINGKSGKSHDWIKVNLGNTYGFVIDGKPVYSEYHDNIHFAGDIGPVEGETIYRGWDFGLTPACTFSQSLPRSFTVFDELCGDDIGIERFADVVLDHCNQHYKGYKFVDYGDPAGNKKAETDEKKCFDIMRGKKINIEPGEQTQVIRKESVRYALNRLDGGEPFFRIGRKCKMTRKGLQGGYNYRRLKVSGERFTDEPDKNAYSHPVESLEYVCTKLFGARVTGDHNKGKTHKGKMLRPRTGVR